MRTPRVEHSALIYSTPEYIDALLRQHRAAALRLAWQIVRNLDDAEDVVQTASLNAYRAFDRFRVDRPFGPWFFTIVANEARTCYRTRARSAAVVRRAAAALTGASDSRPYELRAPLAEALASLSSAHREIVVCRYFLGLSEEETARRLALPKGTVKSRLSRAIDRLRVELGLRGVSAEMAAA